MGFWRTIEKASGLLGRFLARQTDAKVIPLQLRTCRGVVVALDSVDVRGVFSVNALPPWIDATFRSDYLADVLACDSVGAEEGGTVVVVYETGLGLVAARATVERVPDNPEG